MTSEEFVKAREELGLTQDKVADILGISKRQVANYESGKTPIKKTYAEKISSLLHTSTPTPSQTSLPPDILELIQDYQELPEEKKEIYRLKIKKEVIDKKLKEKGVND